ncbi:MAG TPA: threonine--tRNA ligase [bacterium]|nr:threonine--tRNA ligase [Myxococcales bacterium]OQA59069.1 MAG: Threonine--tRNA ligase 1 [bacterium ADurb.Bin270]HPW46169.1 threonine--tRNA ligase [bacterium]
MSSKREKPQIDLDMLRHSAAHIMADAVLRLFPDAKPTIGPSVEDGFYYDFEFKHAFTEEDIKEIEKVMNKIVGEARPFVREELSREDAKKLFADNRYKIELIDELPEEETITAYRHGDFVDLCRGPHVEHTGQVRVFKLLKVAGAYWRGDEKNAQLQRIYGTAFASKEELEKYLKLLEEAAKRDHRKLGKELDLFSSLDDYGPGLILWHPKGARIRDAIEAFWKSEHYKHGYEILYTPHMGRAALWETSGHLDFYKEGMYSPMSVDEFDYYIKPMNCPFHIMIYKKHVRSYRDLPMRWAELGTVYRYEKSGVLHGLLRVRGFTQDDAHIVCTPEQIESEISEVLKFSLFMWDIFGFKDIKAYLATRPADAVGDPERWDQALAALKSAVEKENIAYEMDEGGGAFYGPKIDLKIKDAIGREWQMTTIQFDFNLPERFDMNYIGVDGAKHRPYVVHRALLGSIERFFGVLIEHYAGAFPTWLAPVQVRLLPVGDDFVKYSQSVADDLRAAEVRVEVDSRNEKLGYKIRDAQMNKVPYMLVVGAKESDSSTVAVRSRGEGDLGTMSVEEFKMKILNEITNRRNG